jgi:hypothetical protein
LEVDADLVRLAGFREDAEEAERASVAGFDLPERAGGAAVLGDGHLLFVGRVDGEGSGDLTAVFGGATRDEGEVLLLHEVVLELVGEVALRVFIFREEDEARRLFVDAMHDAEAGVTVAFVRKIQQPRELFEGARILPAPGYRRESWRFGDGDAVVVGPEDL